MTEFAGYEIEVPFGPAAGVLNGTNEALLVNQTIDVLNSPVSFATLGSITWNRSYGNEPVYGIVYYHNKVTGQTFNSMGLPNIGFHRAVEIYPELQARAHELGKPLIPSISAGKSEDSIDVLPKMAEGFAEAGAPAIELNYSCRNKINDAGGREPILGHDIEKMQAVDQEVMRRLGPDFIVIRKLPQYTGEDRKKIPNVCTSFTPAYGNTVLNLCNAIGDMAGLTEIGDPALKVPENLGSMSGPATAPIGCDQLARFRKSLPQGVGFISCLGVMTGQNVFDRVHEQGADLASGVTIYYENEKIGISYGETGARIAQQYADAITTF